MSDFSNAQRSVIRYISRVKKERKKKVNDFITRQIKTYVPIAVGAFIAWLATLGMDLDAETQSGLIVFLTGLSQALYYALVVFLARKFPKLEILLGSIKRPDYK
jgi:hypothetical protein